jgi:hypothetical protein
MKYIMSRVARIKITVGMFQWDVMTMGATTMEL